MTTVLPTVVPVFGLIVLGFLAGRTGYLSAAAITGLPEFVFRIAMPIMLFRTIGNATLPAVSPVAILAAFFGAVGVVWVLAALMTRWPLRQTQADAAAYGMAAAFANSVMMGLPIALAHYGAQAAPIVALVVLFDTAVLWLVATLYLAAGEGSGAEGLGGRLATLSRRLLLNPIILGCAAGLAWQLGGLQLPALADTMVTMLAQAAVPGALVALGLALNTYGLAGQMPAVAMITGLKLLVMPAAAWLIGTRLLALPPLEAGVVAILAAMPVGANAYLFAAAYDRRPAAVSGAIAATTPLALLTVSILLLLLGPGRP